MHNTTEEGLMEDHTVSLNGVDLITRPSATALSFSFVSGLGHRFRLLAARFQHTREAS
jgi:hypothetical protein